MNNGEVNKQVDRVQLAKDEVADFRKRVDMRLNKMKEEANERERIVADPKGYVESQTRGDLRFDNWKRQKEIVRKKKSRLKKIEIGAFVGAVAAMLFVGARVKEFNDESKGRSYIVSDFNDMINSSSFDKVSVAETSNGLSVTLLHKDGDGVVTGHYVSVNEGMDYLDHVMDEFNMTDPEKFIVMASNFMTSNAENFYSYVSDSELKDVAMEAYHKHELENLKNKGVSR